MDILKLSRGVVGRGTEIFGRPRDSHPSDGRLMASSLCGRSTSGMAYASGP